MFKYLYHFTYQQAFACIFPASIFLILALSNLISIPGLYRYDFILILCIVVQFLMIITGLETKAELKVILFFHIIGLMLELFKVQMGSWSYPEPAWSKFYGVPLYSGFMYASVASYLCLAWKRLDVKLVAWPNRLITGLTGLVIYINFFTHHYIYDLRWLLIIVLTWCFRKSVVHFFVHNKWFKMPILLSFVLIGFFIWIAENIATFFGAWKYPNQSISWEIVDMAKISSWSLLIIVSFLIVAQRKQLTKAPIKKAS
ncbi:DUF817 domain-containing protein [Hazenella sp. IB182357]|uniref:DUF817 domain-containing protein n=1 Tax=Polycladospora coralii TaxID=2771432 RepID=A0A926RTS9_9BACL|nr:DUF817 domain-containing protein [Polycladospora coralii]MBD1371717.1 DUF817 domain-containing protein [Polycladospora coralii]MBS7529184.1 DUF817 domain-containing protein [Polycladospora coralii]